MDSKIIPQQGNPQKLNFHKFVAIFPEMKKPAFVEFVADIKLHGVREPIWIYKNQILDGRNRWLACEVLGISCPTRPYVGKDTESDLLDFVVSQNYHRRDMDPSERAMSAARAANMRQGKRTDIEPSGNLQKVSRDAAARFDVSAESVTMAKKVIAKGEPELVKAVGQGKDKIAVSAAAKIAEHPPEVQREAVMKVAAGAKAADVVRELPPSGGKAKPVRLLQPVRLRWCRPNRRRKNRSGKRRQCRRGGRCAVSKMIGRMITTEKICGITTLASSIRCWTLTSGMKSSASRNTSCRGSRASSIRRRVRSWGLSQSW